MISANFYGGRKFRKITVHQFDLNTLSSGNSNHSAQPQIEMFATETLPLFIKGKYNAPEKFLNLYDFFAISIILCKQNQEMGSFRVLPVKIKKTISYHKNFGLSKVTVALSGSCPGVTNISEISRCCLQLTKVK